MHFCQFCKFFPPFLQEKGHLHRYMEVAFGKQANWQAGMIYFCGESESFFCKSRFEAAGILCVF